MATAPKIALRDGTGFTNALVFTTNQDSITITGQVDVSTSDIQISINGAPYVSDPSLVKFSLPNFTIPNPDNFPAGLVLDTGDNVILIRTIDIVGAVSGSSSVTVTKVDSATLTTVQIPTAIRVRRQRDQVTVLAGMPIQTFGGVNSAAVALPTNFLGFNYYASTQPAGATGYFKINESVVSAKFNDFDEIIAPVASESTTFTTNRKFLRVRVSEQDEFHNELAVRLDTTYDVSAIPTSVRFLSTTEGVQVQEYIGFVHTRSGGPGQINSDQFASLQASDPVYYVVTGVYFDPDLNKEIESPYSQEVVGYPLVLDTTIRDLPGRTQRQVQTDYIRAIQRVNREVSLIPGSTTRDVSIDPFASESERLYFVLDFVHRAQSFLTLLQIDDSGGTGVSDPVSGSSYKTALKAALGLPTDAAVQTIIDAAFDKLAGNFKITRLPGRPSIGQAVFYTKNTPATDLTVSAGTFASTTADSSLGIPSVRFRVGGSYTLPASNAQAFYNYSRKRYELTVDIVAETAGAAGNRPAGQITNVTGVSGLQVINDEATIFGSDRESNSDLAARAMLAFVSVDTGTQGGYTATTAAQIGVSKALVVKSGDALMMRDYDPVRHKHIGGKVDIWVQGVAERQVTETFAFTFDIARDINCQIIDVTNLIFRVQDSRVTVNTPIIQILDNITQGLGVRNVTQGIDYDLTGVQILDYQTFKLNPLLPAQPVTDIDDVITADYRFRVVNQFELTFQPVRRVVSVTGEVSGPLDNVLGYSLFKTADPLLEGESTISTDYVAINQVAGLPSGNTITVNAEPHIMIGFIQEPLLSIGINTKTIRVFSADRSIEYDGPDATVPDFSIIDGTPTTPVQIVRTSGTSIPNGSTVSVDYVHDENFSVVYVINDLLQQLQATINERRHITADVIVKQAIENDVDIETTLQLKAGATKDRVDPDTRSAVSLEFEGKKIGEGIAQSDVIQAIDSTSGVNFCIVPFAKMAYADGSRKLRETLFSNATHLPTLDVGGNSVFILDASLEFPTTDTGGLVTEHRGVFQDDEPMTMVSVLTQVGTNSDQAFIIGSGGAVIPGYTDSATLAAQGFTTAAAQQAQLLALTANHVLVSLSTAGPNPDSPTLHKYACSYIVRGDIGAKDVPSSGVEFLNLGNFTITIRSA